MYCFEKYLHGLGSLFSLSTMSFSIKFVLGSMQKWGGSNILYLSKEGLEKIAEKVNPFWKDVFLNLSELKQEKGS
jgi:hypothetical protein